jgi:hypothetical protein
VTGCDGCGDADAADVAASILVASEILFLLSNEKYPGSCADTIRPIGSTSSGCWGRNPDLFATWGGSLGDIRNYRCDHRLSCTCGQPCQLDFAPLLPVTSIEQVLVDGTEVTDFVLLDNRWLARTDGDCWPSCQDMLLASTEPDTFEITYRHGLAPPESGRLAARQLACELVKSCSGGDCQLPARVTSVTRQGISMAILDPLDFLDNGRTGLYFVDLFLKAVNPDGMRGHVSVMSPDYGMSQHRRRD